MMLKALHGARDDALPGFVYLAKLNQQTHQLPASDPLCVNKPVVDWQLPPLPLS